MPSELTSLDPVPIEPAVLPQAEPEPVREHATIAGVEIFRVGRWNGDSYSSADLNAMLDAFDRIGYRPPVKLGHDNDPKAPAYGWVTNLRRTGDVLEADFEDVPDDLVGLIRDGRYDAVSSEIFWDLERDGKKYPRALKAVAILGAHPPGVSNLKPLRASLEAFHGVGEVHACTLYEGIPIMPTMSAADVTPATTDEAAKELAQAQARIAELEAQVKDTAGLRESTGQAAVMLREMQERLARTEAELKAQADARRQAEYDEIVAGCTIPAFRDHIRALAQAFAGENAPKTVMFATVGEGNAMPTEPKVVLRDFVDQLNRRASILFGETSTGKHQARPTSVADGTEADAELDRLVKDFQGKHPGTSYSAATKAVMAMPGNRRLVSTYAAN